MRAIPKRLLIHEAVKYVEEKDRWGNGTPGEEQRLKYVRVEPSSKVIRDKNNAEVQLAATLFYDCRNSQPRSVVWKTDDVVAINGEKYRVQTVEPLYDAKRLHHYEIGMVRYG